MSALVRIAISMQMSLSDAIDGSSTPLQPWSLSASDGRVWVVVAQTSVSIAPPVLLCSQAKAWHRWGVALGCALCVWGVQSWRVVSRLYGAGTSPPHGI